MLKKAASLLLISSHVKHLPKKSTEDYSLLMLKRTSNSRSFAGKIVFPGGMIDKLDFNKKWLNYIESFYTSKQISLLKSKGNLSLLNDQSSEIAFEVALRICAIRETFEESGILLARDKDDNSIYQNPTVYNKILNENWPEKVSANPEMFLELCKSIEIVPDIFALYEWCEWLPPSIVQVKFLAIFFIAFIHEDLPLHINKSEADDGFWKTPTDALREFFVESKQLVPPQISELSYLQQIGSWETLSDRAKYRQKNGGVRNHVVIVSLKDGVTFLMNGDERYPVNGLDFDLKDLTISDLMQDKFQRRSYMKTSFADQIYKCNVDIDSLAGK